MSSNQNVHVVCRIRPTNQKEISENGTVCVKSDDTQIELAMEGSGLGFSSTNNFSFDRIFGPDSTQQQVFDYTAAGLINDVMAGYNATIFAYGQTGSGKVLSC